MAVQKRFPGITSLIGRAVNTMGEPIDGQGPLPPSSHIPIVPLASYDTTTTPIRANRQLETGIKPVDLFAPISRGGTVAISGPPGTGQLVLVEELLYMFPKHYQGFIISMGSDEYAYEMSDMVQVTRDSIGPQNLVRIFETIDPEHEHTLYATIIEIGLALAIDLRRQGHEVLLVVNEHLIHHSEQTLLTTLQQVIRHYGLIALLLVGDEIHVDSNAAAALQENLDGSIVFNSSLFRQGIYPAIDPFLSTSQLLTQKIALEEHLNIVGEVRAALQRYQELKKSRTPGLTSEDQQLIKRARRLQYFLTSPYVIAEPFSHIPGEYVSLQDTLKGCRELLAGHHDELPEQSFYMVGTLEQAIAKGRHLLQKNQPREG